jgi:hypothetical protein
LHRKNIDDLSPAYVFSISYVSQRGWHERRFTMLMAITVPLAIGDALKQ